jgi:IclR family acetate operon transcriptional repressor
MTKETVNLALPFVFDCMIVESLEGSYGVRATSYAGSRAHYHSSACGKAILAFMPLEVREALYATRPLVAMTPNTIVDKAVLERDLSDVRKCGFSTDIEENELGAHCAAAPVRDQAGDVIGAISISGLASRFPKSQLSDIASLILSEGETLSRLLGQKAKKAPVRS